MYQIRIWPVRKIDLATFEPEEQIGLQIVDIENEPIFIPLDGAQIARLAKNLSEMVRKRPDVLAWKAPPLPK